MPVSPTAHARHQILVPVLRWALAGWPMLIVSCAPGVVQPGQSCNDIAEGQPRCTDGVAGNPDGDGVPGQVGGPQTGPDDGPTVCSPGQTRACDTGLAGVCAAGTQACADNQWSSCTLNAAAGAEVCGDNQDNDCDGATDCVDAQCAAEPACSPSLDCTITVQPGGSIQSAVDSAASGDVICIAAGTYTGRIQVNTAGITIKGEVPRTATIVNGFHVDAPDVRIEGLRLTTNMEVYQGLTFLDGHADNARIYDNYYYEANVYCSIFGPHGDATTPDNVHVKGNLFHRVNGGVAAVGNNWVVEDNEIDTLVTFGAHDSNYMVVHGSGHIFRNNYMHGATIATTQNSHVDCFQTFDQNGPYDYHNILIDHNACFGFHEFAMLQSWAGRHDGITITNNLIVNLQAWGYFDGCPNGDPCELRPIIAEGVPNLTIEHNTIIGSSDIMIVMQTSANPSSGSIKNNLMGTMRTAYVAADCSPACDIANNMIWDYTQSVGDPLDADNILDSTGFVNPVVTNDWSQWRPTNPVACTGGTGGTHIGAVPCN